MDLLGYIKLALNITDHTKVIVWGGGIRGLQLFDILRELNISVYAYADNDEVKQINGVRGLRCFSNEQLMDFAITNDICILVSPAKSDALYAELCISFNKIFPHEIYELLYSAVSLMPYEGFIPIGHYYSLYPDLQEIHKREDIIYDKNKNIYDIDLYENEQRMLYTEMAKLFTSIPSWDDMANRKESRFRYRYHNQAFSAADAITLHCMLRILKPNRMIEVGSGWSSAVTLDTNEFYLNHLVDLTFIEPYPAQLKRILKDTDEIVLHTKGLQEIPVTVFERLEAGDILFIDSTHVSKIGSDVNYLFFEILPRLKAGVYIHLHDIFYPFEYPKEWIQKGRIWNELYVLRAFLQNNKQYRILYFQNMIQNKYKELIKDSWPLEDSFDGGSFYMQKL